jgi:hypothetical protein
VDLVDEEHLVAVAHRRNRQALDDHLAHVVDAGVGGGIDLEHVDVTTFGDLDARVAHAARRRRRPVDAVQRPGEDAGGGGLAAAARPGEDKGLGDALALQGVAQGAGDGLLAQDVVERLGPPLPRERLVGHEVCDPPAGYGPHRSPEVLQHISGAAERCCLPALTRFAD